ncbi:MAG: hypothetical protein ACM3VS_19015 [Candidatus Dadabacteria bacterium]
MNPLETPTHIFTSYIGVSHICFSHEDSRITLLGCYGELVTGEMKTIEIETNFDTLYELLTSIEEQADDAMEAMANRLMEPRSDNEILDLVDAGGLHFNDHIFALMRIHEEEDGYHSTQPENITYVLNAYIDRKKLLPEFISTSLPSGVQNFLLYCNRLLAIRYRFYLVFRKTMNRLMALSVANLTDPVIYTMARTQYKVLKRTRF